MPRLLIDGTALSTENKGVGRYTYHLCIQASRRLPADWEIMIARLPLALPVFPDDFRASYVTLPRASDLRKGLYLMPRLIDRIRPDVLVRPMEGAGFDYGVPMITVCHDIAELIRQAAHERSGIWRGIMNRANEYFQVRAMRASSLVICNSNFIRNAVTRYYGIPASRTALGYCGVDSRFYLLSRGVDADIVRQRYAVKRYVLTFATGDAREGFDVVPEILDAIRARNISTCLMIAGVEEGARYVNDLRRRLVALGFDEGRDFLFLEFLAEDRLADLVSVYTAADFYLELSRHEGFGMQLAEAMACGTTCVAGTSGALREVAGGFAIEIDPVDTEGVASTLADAYKRDQHTRDNTLQVEYTRRFDWNAVGKLVVENVLQLAG